MNGRSLWAGLLMMLAGSVFAGNTLDTGFGFENGIARFEVPNNVRLIGAHPVANNKFVAVTSEKLPGSDDERVTIRRFNRNGALDTSFNGTGIRQLNLRGFADKSERAGATVVYPNGRILIVGTIMATVPPQYPGQGDGSIVFLYRLKADGSPDMDFGTDALKSYSDSSVHHCNSVKDAVYMPDTSAGSITVLCDSDIATKYVTLLRFADDGTFFPSFGTNGSTIYAPPGIGPVTPVAMTAFAREIFLIANANDGSDNANQFVLVFNFDFRGIIKKSFGNEGSALFSEAHRSIAAKSIAISNSKPVILLDYPDYPNQGEHRALLRQLKENGSTDTDFGDQGTKLFGSASQPMQGGKLRIGLNRRIWVINETGCTSNAGCNLAVTRLKLDGKNDDLFSTTGPLIITPSGSGYINALQTADLRDDGSLLLGVNVTPTPSGNKQIAMARLVPDDITPKLFRFKSKVNTAPGSDVTSEEVELKEINTAIVLRSDTALFSLNGGVWKSRFAIAEPGDKLRVQHRTLGNYGLTTESTITVGDATVTFTTTNSPPPPPEDDGGGAWDMLLLGALALLMERRRRR